MKLTQRGYTLPELLVVIVVLVILSTIAVVGWESVSAWSRDRAREQDTQQWVSTFDLYKSRFVVYPVMPTADGLPATFRCLGTPASFPNGKCGQFNSTDITRGIPASASSGLEAEITKVGKMPVNSNEKIRNLLTGPVLRVVKSTSGTTTTVDAWFINFFENGCPKNFQPSSSHPGVADAIVAGLPAGTMVHTCIIKKNFQITSS